MKLAVISDIHGNLEAFGEVLSDIDACRADAVVCLGDVIGYGPDPGPVIALLKLRAIPCVMGNHELAVVDPKHMEWFNPRARKSLQMTAEMLTARDMRFISSLKTSLVRHECRFVHGFPPDSVTTYHFQVAPDSLPRIFNEFSEKVCFIGHTHTLETIEFDGQSSKYALLARGVRELDKKHRYIINIGSVGQPRDGNNNAKYVIFDTVRHSIEVRFVAYDIDSVVRKIRAAGLPNEHGSRLF